jgi:N-acetylneuraminic acid mutarotase
MPTARSNFGIATYKGKIYVIGGTAGWTSNTGTVITGVNEVYDPVTDTWAQKASMLTHRTGMVANVVNGKIYVISGITGGPSSAVASNEVYDPSINSWTAKADIPYPVNGYASAVVDNQIYVIGGQTNSPNTSGSHNAAFVQIYDPEVDEWSFGNSMPIIVGQAAAAATSGLRASKKIYVFGGLPVKSMDATNITQVYDPYTNSWSVAASMPLARCGASVANINDVLYVIGGSRWTGVGASTSGGAVNQQYMPIGYKSDVGGFQLIPVITGIVGTIATIMIVLVLFLKRKRNKLAK